MASRERNLEENERAGLLDLLIVLAEHIKLLVAASLLGCLLAAGISYAVPKSYVSTAILVLPKPATGGIPLRVQYQTPAQATQIITSPRVLDRVIAQLNLANGGSIDAVRSQVAKRVKAVVGPDELLRIEVKSSTPQQAQTLANALIDNWLETTVLSAQERADLESVLRNAESSLGATRRMIEQLATENHDKGNSERPRLHGETGAVLFTTAELQTHQLSETLEIARLLRGFSRDTVLIQAPTLPIEPNAPPLGLVALLGALAACIAATAWVFLVQAWRSAAQDPRLAAKFSRLRSALGLKQVS